MSGKKAGVYLITPPTLDPATFAAKLTDALATGCVDLLQLRLKDVGDDIWLRAIDALLPIAKAHNVPFLLNDRADLVRQTGSDGAHVGQDDMPPEVARAVMGAGRTLGVTCKGDLDLAREAVIADADYVAFGPFAASKTKMVSAPRDPSLLAAWAAESSVPSCAIGGITPANCAPLVRAGARYLAVVDTVWSHPDGPGAGVRALDAAIQAAL